MKRKLKKWTEELKGTNRWRRGTSRRTPIVGSPAENVTAEHASYPKQLSANRPKGPDQKYTDWNEEVANDQHGRWLLGSDLEERASQTLAVIYFSDLFIRLLN